MRRFIAILCTVLLFLTSFGAQASSLQGTPAYVNNPNPRDRLNLRTQPRISSPSLGKYFNGVAVQVLAEYNDGWMHVQIGNLTGYMLSQYLTKTNIPASAIPTMYVNNPNPKHRLNLRKTQSVKSTSLDKYANGTSVQVLGMSDSWSHVMVGGKTGFMKNEFLVASASAIATPSPVGTPTPVYTPRPVATTPPSSGGKPASSVAVVSNDKPTNRLNLRTSPNTKAESIGRYYTGVRVAVLESAANGYTKVRVGGIEGYMLTRFLAFGTDGDAVVSAIPKCVLPSTLTLRSGASDGAKAIKTVEKGETIYMLAHFSGLWWHVQAGSNAGYMKLPAGTVK